LELQESMKSFKHSRIYDVPVIGSLYGVLRNFKWEYFRFDFEPTPENYIDWDLVTSVTGKYAELGGMSGLFSLIGNSLLRNRIFGEPYDTLLNVVLGTASIGLFGLGSLINSRKRRIDWEYIAKRSTKNGYGEQIADIQKNIMHMQNDIGELRNYVLPKSELEDVLED